MKKYLWNEFSALRSHSSSFSVPCLLVNMKSWQPALNFCFRLSLLNCHILSLLLHIFNFCWFAYWLHFIASRATATTTTKEKQTLMFAIVITFYLVETKDFLTLNPASHKWKWVKILVKLFFFSFFKLTFQDFFMISHFRRKFLVNQIYG